MKNLTAIIISFLRPAYTIACIESLKEIYPDIQICVGENGDFDKNVADVCTKYGAKYIKLPYDSGVCVGRNTLMQHVETEYVLVGDDDFFYTKDAMVDKMLSFMERHQEFDLIGGRIIENGMVRNYQGSIERRGRGIRNTPIDLDTAEFETDEETGLRYIKTDLVFNFFVACTYRVRPIKWDEQIKVAYEHESWFIDLQEAKRNVAFSPEPIVIHKPEHIRAIVEKTELHPTYRAFRMRRTDKERFFSRHKLDYVIDMNGTKDYSPNNPIEIKKNDTKFVDFCITTFKRPKALERLLFSIVDFYPMANIYIADQNEVLDREFYKELRSKLYDAGLAKRVSVESLPYDCGLSYARNHLVTTTPNKYKLILDDDMMFTEGTDIGKMLKVMEADPRAGIVGGLLKQNGIDMHYEFTPVKKGDTIYHTPDMSNWKESEGVKYRKVGCVFNFALMKAEIFRYNQWDPDLKVTEHLDFYMRFKDLAYNVLYTPDVWIDHPNTAREGDYKEFRERPEFQVHMLKKHGVIRVKHLNGQVVQLEKDGSLTRYKEKPEEVKI